MPKTAIAPELFNSEVASFFSSVVHQATELRKRIDLVPEALRPQVSLRPNQLISLVASVDSIFGGLPLALRTMAVDGETLATGQVLEGTVYSRRLSERDGEEFYDLSIALNEQKEGCIQTVSVVVPTAKMQWDADWLLTRRVRVQLGECFWEDSYERIAQLIELATEHMASTTPRTVTDNYRRGYVNASTQPGVPYTGRIVNYELECRDEEGDPNPYDRWVLDLLLNPSIAKDGGEDVIEIYADNPKIKKQEVEGCFHPDKYVGRNVRVVLGDYPYPEDSEKRCVTSIELI